MLKNFHSKSYKTKIKTLKHWLFISISKRTKIFENINMNNFNNRQIFFKCIELESFNFQGL